MPLLDETGQVFQTEMIGIRGPGCGESVRQFDQFLTQRFRVAFGLKLFQASRRVIDPLEQRLQLFQAGFVVLVLHSP